MDKKLIELVIELKDKLTPGLKKAGTQGSKAVEGLGRQTKKTTMELFQIAKATAKFEISLEKQIVALKAQAKALRDPAIQQRIKDIKTLEDANRKFKKSLTTTTEDIKKQSKAVKFGVSQLVAYAKVAGGLLILRQVGRWMIGAAQSAENYQTQLRALEFQTARVGVSSEKLIDNLKRVTQGQVAMEDLVLSANRAIALIGTQSIPLMDELAESALKASQVMGISVKQALDNLAIGIGRQSRLILDNLGVIISITKANENYAKSLGKTADELTEVEKKAAFLMEVTKQLDDKFKDLDVSLSATDGLRASIKDLKLEIGEGLLPVYKATLEVINDLIHAQDRYRAAGRFGFLEAFEEAMARRPVFSTIAELEAQMEELKERTRRAPVSFVDKSQIQMVDDFRNKIRELTETLRLLRDPEVIKLITETKKLEKQITETMNSILGIKKPIDDVTESVDRQAKAVHSLGEVWKSAGAEFSDFLAKIRSEWDKYLITDAATDPTSPFYIPLAEGMVKPTVDRPKGAVGAEFADYIQGIRSEFDDEEFKGFKLLEREEAIKEILAGGIGGFAAGGLRGGISAMLPLIGSAFGPLGTAIGGFVGGIFGKRRRGETPQNPVFTSDVSLQQSMIELLNAVKSQLLIQAGAGIDRISAQLAAQATAGGSL